MPDIHPERTVELTALDKGERSILRRMVGWVLIAGLVLAIVLMIPGCATQAQEEIVTQVCYLKFMGKTEEGYTVVMQACQSPEQFAARQQ